MKHWLFLLLLIPSGAAQTIDWIAPDEGTHGGVLHLRVEADAQATPAYSVDQPAGKGETRILTQMSCAERCIYEGFLDTQEFGDGAHEVWMNDLSTNAPSVARAFAFNNSEPIHRLFLWPDPLNPWPETLDEPGTVRLLAWMINVGNQPATVQATVDTPAGWGQPQFREVDRVANQQGNVGAWDISAARSVRVNFVSEVETLAPGTVTWTLASEDAEYSVSHEWKGSTAGPETSATPGFGVIGLLAAASAARRIRS